MTKKIVRVDLVSTPVDSFLDGKVVDVLAKLQYLLSKTNEQYHDTLQLEADVYTSYGEAGCDIQVYYLRDETDEEYEVRTKVEARQAEMSRKYKLQQYLKLKDELGDLV